MNIENLGLTLTKEVIEKTYYEFKAINGLEYNWLLDTFVDILLKNLEKAEEEINE